MVWTRDASTGGVGRSGGEVTHVLDGIEWLQNQPCRSGLAAHRQLWRTNGRRLWNSNEDLLYRCGGTYSVVRVLGI